MVTFFQKHKQFWKIEIKICFLTSSFWLLIWGAFYVEVHEYKAVTRIIFLIVFTQVNQLWKTLQVVNSLWYCENKKMYLWIKQHILMWNFKVSIHITSLRQWLDSLASKRSVFRYKKDILKFWNVSTNKIYFKNKLLRGKVCRLYRDFFLPFSLWGFVSHLSSLCC